ncbi:hypothetical protein EGW08_018331 [Elysia chlorotica]|uniref:Receptor ligand binding region domain-containing protein n=1 Tax=Elysia chlorotica TaxID=188477 RepID=A0A3S0ZFV8_ELYCH|nr:hypothetical protein EGW08_018331 [Elysia chlorotica]
MNEAIKVYDDKLVDVFIGPVCDYAVAPIARQIRYWEIPLITPGALAGAFGEEKTFPNLVRVGANFYSMASMIISIMDQFTWSRVKVIYDPNGLNSIMDRYCFVASDTIVKTLRTDPDKVQDYQAFYNVKEFFQAMNEEIGNDWAGASGRNAGKVMIIPNSSIPGFKPRIGNSPCAWESDTRGKVRVRV